MTPFALTKLSVLLSAALLCSCQEATIEPKINRTIANVDGFDLVFDDSAVRAEFGLFELGYAIKANYQYFTYRGKIYQSVGGGSVLIRRVSNSPAKFVVRETAQLKGADGRLSRSTLQILDKSTGEEVARRGLIAHAVESDTGWTGDHAMRFVRKVLTSEQTPSKSWGITGYAPSIAKVELVKPSGSTPYPHQLTPRNCPATLRIERRPYDSVVVGMGFEFLPRNPLKLVACDSGRVLVASGIYSSNLNWDLLTIGGDHIAQGYVQLPLPLGSDWFDLSDVTLATETINVLLLVNHRVDWKFPFAPFAQVQVSATLHCSKPDCVLRSP
nr:hypothetical protein [Rhodoferax sp.]